MQQGPVCLVSSATAVCFGQNGFGSLSDVSDIANGRCHQVRGSSGSPSRALSICIRSLTYWQFQSQPKYISFVSSEYSVFAVKHRVGITSSPADVLDRLNQNHHGRGTRLACQSRSLGSNSPRALQKEDPQASTNGEPWLLGPWASPAPRQHSPIMSA